MPSILFKELFRKIRNSLGRYLSLMAIVAIGVAFFAGVKASAPIMKHSADTYFDKYNVQDIQLYSTLGLDQEDLDEIKKVKGVEDVLGTFSQDYLSSFDKREMVVKVISLEKGQSINKPRLTEGHLPQSEDQCVIESAGVRSELFGDFKIGDKITLSTPEDEKIEDTLKTNTFTIVGKAYNPNYLSYEKGTSSLGSGEVDTFIYIEQQAVAADYYTEADIIVKGARELDTYSDAYFDLIDPVVEDLEDLADKQIEARISQMKSEVDDRQKELDDQIDKARQDLQTQLKELDNPFIPQAQREAIQAQGEAEIEKEREQAQEKIDEAYKQIDDLDPEWIILDRQSHYSYRDYESTADRMDGIASVFPVFFYLVAALVCMTTMTRLVEEERTDIGTLKALGYSRYQIAGLYLLYAFSASVLGCIVGCILGITIFPLVIFTAWNVMYNLEAIVYLLPWDLVFLASLSVMAIIMAATLYSIYVELQEAPAQLMRPKAAKAGKKIWLEHIPWLWSRFSFMRKVTLRNIFRYKKRFFMTVLGIAGCSALLVSGFGINDSITDIVPSQYGKIYHYDATLSYDGEKNIKDEIEKTEGVENVYEEQSLPVDIHYDGKDVAATLHILNDIEGFEDFMTFIPVMNSDKNMKLDDQGVFISIKTAEKMNVQVGDPFTFETADDETITTKVSGIFDQFIEHQIYVSQDLFDSWKLEEKPSISYLLDLDVEKEDEIGSELLTLDGVKGIVLYSSLQENFLNMINSIKLVVVVLVLSAAALAFVVLYNLSNVNISERQREIATIKVLGFTDREVSEYVNRESFALACIGSVAGLVIGIWLHNLIMNLAELDTIRFGRTIFPQSFVLAVVLTLVFTLIINWIMRFKLRKIEMVESLKAIE